MRACIICIILLALAAGGAPGAQSGDQYARGLNLFNSGDWSGAAVTLSRVAARDTTSPAVHLTAGVALANVKRYQDAVVAFETASRLSPSGVLPLMLLEATYIEMGKQELARGPREQAGRMIDGRTAYGLPGSSDQILQVEVQKHPQNAIAHLLLGDLYQLQGKLTPAKQQYKIARELAPRWVKPVFNTAIANLQADPKAAEGDFDAAAALDPGNLRIQLWKGDALINQGRFQDGVRAYQRAGVDPRLTAEAQTRIGNAELKAGRWAQATNYFGLAAANAPQDPRPIAGQAQALQNAGNLPEAERKYSQAADVLYSNKAPAPAQAAVQNQLANVQLQQQRVGEAVTTFKNSYELHPTTDNAVALVNAQRGDNQLGTAIGANQKAIEKNPKDKAALIYLLTAYKTSGFVQGRIDIAKKLIKADPANAVSYYAELGSAQMAANDPTAAVEAYRKALELGNAGTWADTAASAVASGAVGLVRENVESSFRASKGVSAGVQLLELQSAQRDTAGAVKTAEKLVEISPDRPTLWLRLGQAYEAAGEPALAKAAYVRASASSDPEASALASERLRAIK